MIHVAKSLHVSSGNKSNFTLLLIEWLSIRPRAIKYIPSAPTAL